MLNIEYKKIGELNPYANNAKIHGKKQIEKISKSITEFGFNAPILIDAKNEIIAGHGRLEAAKKLGLDDVPTVCLPHLTEAQKKAYILADNRLGEIDTEWDFDLISEELNSMLDTDFDIELTGFDDSFLIEEPSEGLTDEDAAPELDEENEPVTKRGDIWLCGDHRVMCGDSISEDDVGLLMDGEVVDMIFTDPPYNVGFNGRSGKHDVIKNDDLPEDEFDVFIGKVIGMIKSIDPSVYYVWCNWKFYGVLQGGA